MDPTPPVLRVTTRRTFRPPLTVGEGAVYGLLAKLEENGLVEGRWRESSSTMKKSYYLTDRGTRLLKRELASAGELQGWANLVLGRG